MSLILKLLIFFYTIIIINLLKIENDFNKKIENKIISYTLDNNPNDIKNFLPKLPKIFTKVGLQCDFPFIYKEIEYKSNCATRKSDSKQICKVSLIPRREKTTEDEKRIKYFSSLLDSEKTLIKINEDYYSECLSIDETEQILTQFLENGQKFDINRKLLTDLFSEIKMEIKNSKDNQSLLELFKLADNFCKSENFNFDCLYQNLIMPVSKTVSLKSLSQNIFVIIEKYKDKLKRFVEKSQSANFRFKQFEFIKDENINFESQKLNLKNDTDTIQDSNLINQNGSEDENYIQDIDSDVENEIDKDSVYDSQNQRAKKIFFKQFIKILISVYHICTEECKSTLDYIFVENFGDQSHKIRKEIVAYLFRLNDTDFHVEKDILMNTPHYASNDGNSLKNVLYNKNKFGLNNHLKIFLNYENWSTRYLIAIFYRYILIEKNFFTEIIKGELKEEEMKKMLFGNQNSENNMLNLKNEFKIMKTVPLISPYYNFTHSLKKKLKIIFGEWSMVSDMIFKEYNQTIKILNDLDKKLTIYNSKLEEKINFFRTEMKSKIKDIKILRDNIERNTKIIKDSTKSNSSLIDYKLNSNFLNVEYLTDLIYKKDFLSNECHKFIHYHTYLDELALGIPYMNYVGVSSIWPHFFVEFDKDIRLFDIYGILNFSKVPSGTVRYLIRIETNSEIEFDIDDETQKFLDYDNKTEINNFKNRKFKYIIEITQRKICKFKISGRFEGKTYQENKILMFKIEKIAILNQEMQSNFTQRDKNSETQVDSKCEEKISEVDICFDPFIYNIECNLGCKILSKKYLKGVKERNHIKESADKYHNDKKSLYKMKFFKFNIKFNKKKFYDDQIESKRSKFIENEFISTCNNYCKSFTWNIPIYKCLFRNIESNDLSTLLIKCSGIRDWEIVGRNTNFNTWFNFTNIQSKDDILLGKSNFTENPIKIELIPYTKSTFYNPLSEISFNIPFENVGSSNMEYMFASGDMKYFVVLDSNKLFIKGAPYNARSKVNQNLILKRNKNLNDIYEVSIFNLLYSTDFMSNEGIVIYDSKYNEKSVVVFSDSKNFTISNNPKNILKENKGANIYIRTNGNYPCVESEISKKFLIISNLASKEFYFEYVIAKENIYAFSDNSQDMILKLPESLSKNSFLVRTKTYQQYYSFVTNMAVKIYLPLELTRNIEKNAQKVLEDGWMSLNGSDNLIEIINTDLDQEVLKYNKDEDKIFNLDNLNNFINSIKYTIFYKYFDAGSIDISFSFFDFDDLYSCRHLLLIQTLECIDNNDNGINNSLGLNKLKINQTEISNEYIKKFEEILPSHVELEIKKDELLNNICQKSKKSGDKIINDYLKYADHINVECNETLVDETITQDITNNQTLNNSNNYTIPMIRTNSNGCIVVLDKFGNLFYKVLNNNQVTSSWINIKDNVKYFDISENEIIISDAFNNLAIQNILNQNDNNGPKKDAWNYLNRIPNEIFTKFSLSTYNCIWLLDNKNNLYYGRVNQNDLTLIKSEENNYSEIKDIYQYDTSLYILNKKDEIFIKENIYDFYNDECNGGKTSVKVDLDFELFNGIKSLRKDSKSGIFFLSNDGNLFYDKNFNQNKKLIRFKTIEMNAKDMNPLEKALDFDLNSGSIFTISANEKITAYTMIKKERIYNRFR